MESEASTLRVPALTSGSGLSHPLRKFLQILVLIWAATLISCWFQRNILHWPASNWYPFFLPEFRFNDFSSWRERFQHLHKPDFFDVPGLPYNYPTFAGLILDGFYSLGRFGLGVFLTFCVVVFSAAGLMLGRGMTRRGLDKGQTVLFLGTALLLSYPFWFLLDRANIEMINWFFVAAGVAAYWKRRWYTAATFLGLAVSFKIFPFVFLGLLFSARKYRALLWGLVVCAVTTFASNWIFGPTASLAAAGLSKGLQWYKLHYILEIHPAETGFDHSLFELIKLATFPGIAAEHAHYLPILNWYMGIAATVGVVLFFRKICRLPRANQILALTVASLLFPPISADYRLIHLYIPWGALVLISIPMRDRQQLRGLAFSFACLAFLMAPESFFAIHGVKFAGQLKAIVLFVLFLVSITCPFEEQAYEGEVEQAAGSHAADRHSLHSATV